jgi:hypothetical protein
MDDDKLREVRWRKPRDLPQSIAKIRWTERGIPLRDELSLNCRLSVRLPTVSKTLRVQQYPSKGFDLVMLVEPVAQVSACRKLPARAS